NTAPLCRATYCCAWPRCPVPRRWAGRTKPAVSRPANQPTSWWCRSLRLTRAIHMSAFLPPICPCGVSSIAVDGPIRFPSILREWKRSCKPIFRVLVLWLISPQGELGLSVPFAGVRANQQGFAHEHNHFSSVRRPDRSAPDRLACLERRQPKGQELALGQGRHRLRESKNLQRPRLGVLHSPVRRLPHQRTRP